MDESLIEICAYVLCNTRRDASALIVEQADTGDLNLEYAALSPELHRQLVAIAACEPNFV